MRARVFITALIALLAAAVLIAPRVGEAQAAASTPRIGLLSPTSPSDPRTPRYLGALRQGLWELGYVEGKNIIIEYRWAEGKYDRLPNLAGELVRLKVSVIVTYSAPAIQAAKEATATIPIVMALTGDPVSSGLVAGLARPGGNTTGLSLMAPEVAGKQLEILREVVPKVSLVAILGNPANTGIVPQLEHAQETARALGIRLQSVEVRGPSELIQAFAGIKKERAGAVIVLADPMLIDQRTRIADLSVKRHLPTVGGQSDYAEAGCLISYGPSTVERFRRAATYVDKILKGAKPADLPIEQPTKFELIINLKTARKLGLTIPQSLLGRADQIIK
jgi:putative ABC transport system substrate-binding protein